MYTQPSHQYHPRCSIYALILFEHIVSFQNGIKFSSMIQYVYCVYIYIYFFQSTRFLHYICSVGFASNCNGLHARKKRKIVVKRTCRLQLPICVEDIPASKKQHSCRTIQYVENCNTAFNEAQPSSHVSCMTIFFRKDFSASKQLP